MNTFAMLHFIRPYWLLLLPLVIILPWWWHRSRRPSGDWTRVCDPHLLRWLSVKQSDEKSRGGGRWLAGMALLISLSVFRVKMSVHYTAQAQCTCFTALRLPISFQRLAAITGLKTNWGVTTLLSSLRSSAGEPVHSSCTRMVAKS